MKHIKPKIKIKITYEVIYTPELTTKIFNLMSKIDLGIIGGEMPITERLSWNTTTKVDAVYRSRMRRAIRNALKASGITQIHKIKKVN